MIEVFKTNVAQESDAKAISQQLLEYFPLSRINFDLEDCDKILRIESKCIDHPKVIQVLTENKFLCEILE